MAGWGDSDRKQRLPADWAALRAKCKDRAGGRCEWKLPSGARCPRHGTDADHKVAGDNHALWNLQWLCGAHHDRKTAIDAQRAKNALHRKIRRPPERHPGLR